ncbi:hypothetical protein [Methylobacterium sp. Leaf99]|jgi:hypothetical protein|uniref:hypothetical protein n=1 Tax=Methylobacterium sp. Leaf99 TaxID=1736251 RepID=UPI000AF0A5D7|nr:hypothetical protein [Methylobacterium sp. Leaf99]
MPAAETVKTYYVVQSFTKEHAGLRMDAPIQANSESSARKTAERLSQRKAAVVAIARTGNPTTGEFEEPTVLAQYGRLDDEDDMGLPF